MHSGEVIKYSKYFQQPDDDQNDYDYIEYAFDFSIHGNIWVDEP